MEKFKVLLINPPYFFNKSAAKITHLAMDKKPPLGILYVATYLKAKSDFEIKILDAELEKMDEQKIAEKILEFKPDVAGISVVSFKLYPVYKSVQAIKKVCSQTHVCLGGPHLKIYPKESLNYAQVDSIIIGDGEIPFFRLCKNLSENKPIEDIEGCYTRKNIPTDGIFGKFETPNLGDLPSPDLTLLDYKKYRSFLTNKIIATVITSRGCPHNCIFCQLDRKVRLIPVDKVVDEIESYLKLGAQEIEFYDETFNISASRVIELAEKIISRNLKFEWSFRGRVNAVNQEMCDKIKQAGCQRIQYGVEAGSDKTLLTLKKGTHLKMIRKCFELTRRAKIETVAYFIIGNPGETRQDVMDTINFSLRLKADYVNFAIFLLVPGVEAYKMALEQKVIDQDCWLEYVKDPKQALPMLYWDKKLTQQELIKLKSLAVRKFYLRPIYLIKKLKKLHPKNLFNYTKIFYYMIFDTLTAK